VHSCWVRLSLGGLNLRDLRVALVLSMYTVLTLTTFEVRIIIIWVTGLEVMYEFHCKRLLQSSDFSRAVK